MIKKKCFKKIVCVLSAVVLAFSWYVHTEEQVPVQGATYTNALIQEKQREIEEANAQRAERNWMQSL